MRREVEDSTERVAENGIARCYSDLSCPLLGTSPRFGGSCLAIRCFGAKSRRPPRPAPLVPAL
jgi:hypothetical protein